MNKIIELFKSGLYIKEIAKELHKSREDVSKELRQLGFRTGNKRSKRIEKLRAWGFNSVEEVSNYQKENKIKILGV